jgi:hypothetical protein
MGTPAFVAPVYDATRLEDGIDIRATACGRQPSPDHVIEAPGQDCRPQLPGSHGEIQGA